MSIGNTEYGYSYEVQRSLRMCCCGRQLHLGDKDSQVLTMHPEWQLRNLGETFKDEIVGQDIYDIREFFHDSQIVFRYRGCPRSTLLCCGSCMRVCKSRCSQDVLNRAFLLCANIIYASEGDKAERYKQAGTAIQFLYDEMVSEVPKYFAISAMLIDIISPVFNKELERIIGEQYGNEDSPYRMDYAPVIEYESTSDGRYRKKVDIESGEVSVLHWPRSGMCPFCLPTGLSDRRRKK